MRAILVSIWEPSGRSSKFTGGRKVADTDRGSRAWRTFLWGFVHDPSFGMMKVTVKLWWTMSRLANSTRGIRWPNPGDGTSPT